MIKTYVSVIILILLYSCTNDTEQFIIEEKVNSVKQVSLSLDKPYTTSPYNDKPVESVEFRSDDLQTGKFFPINRFIDTVFTSIPIVGNLSTEKIINKKATNTNLNVLDQKKPIQFEWQELSGQFTFKDFTFQNLTGTTFPMQLPEISHMLKPVFKDNANYNIKYLDVEQGLKSSYVWTTCEDRKGQVWIGSNGSGLTMYNGEDIFDYSKTNDCIGSYVWKIIEDSKNNIWLSTWENGIIKFDGENFYHYNVSNGFFANDIQSLFEDTDGNIWVGSYSKGVAVIRNNSYCHLQNNAGLDKVQVECFEEDSEGNLYVGTTDFGLIRIGPKGIHQLTSTEFDLTKNVFSIEYVENTDKLVFSVIDIGVFFLSDKVLKKLDNTDGLANNRVQYIQNTNNNDLCFAFFREGIQLWGDHNVVSINDKNGLSNVSVLQMSSSGDSKIWICTDGGGLNLLKPNSFKLLNENAGFMKSHVNCSAQFDDTTLLFGTEFGLVKYFGENHEYYENYKELKDFNIAKVFRDSKNCFWLATSKGIIKIEGNKYYLWNDQSGLQDHVIQDIIEDDKGILWIGTYNDGIYTLDPNNNEIKLIHNKAFSLSFGGWSSYKDKNRLFLGTWSYGLLEIKEDSLRLITTKEGLSSNNILSIEKIENTLILGTNNRGINFIQDGIIYYLTTEEGLPNNSIWDICVHNNQIWFGTEHGLAKLNYKDKIEESLSGLAAYSAKDGMKGVDAYANSLLFDHRGNLWFASGKGLISCSKKALENSNSTPKIMLENLEINEMDYDFRNTPKSKKFHFDSILPFQNIPKGLELEHNQNNVTIHFVGIDWENHENIQYSYRLKGASEFWSFPKEESKADYKNLPPGDYIFELRARSKNNEWSEIITLEFSVEHPWWSSWWAKSTYIIFSFLFIVLIIQYRSKKAISRRKELEEKIKLATSEIRNQKEQIEKTRDDKIKLSQRIIEQDKYILLNQTANTVAHELNSPLGILKNGDAQLSNYVDELLNQILPECTKSTIEWCLNQASKLSKEFTIDRQKVKSKRKIKEWIEANYNDNQVNTEILQHLLSSDLNATNKDQIDHVLSTENPVMTIRLLTVLCRIEKIKKMNSEAANKCIQVIGSLTKALNVEQEIKLERINIIENLNSVLDLFVENNLEFSVENKRPIFHCYGSEFELFQMWYNLISLLKETNSSIHISFEEKNNLLTILFSVQRLQFEQVEQFEGIFDFKKTDNSTKVNISVVNKIVSSMGIKMEIQSDLNILSFTFQT